MNKPAATGPLSSPDRLDSWKAIAQYLGRDERTVRRWEKTLGLPVRRVPGGRGHSVFAFVTELETWLRAREDDPAAASPDENVIALAPPHPSRRWRRIAPMAAVVVGAAAVSAWAIARSGTADNRLQARLTPEAVIAADVTGAEQWRYLLPPDERAVWLEPPAVISGSSPGVLAAASVLFKKGSSAELGGRLFFLTPRGALERTWQIDDQLTFAEKTYGPPWVITDVQTIDTNGRRRVAVSAHHYNWWPSIVVLLDQSWRRQATFVNPGWIEQARWIDDRQLVVSGFSNDRDAGMVTLLDADAFAEQAPVPAREEFRCATCGDRPPRRYLAFPRTEINRAAGAPFNRAYLQLAGDRVIVRTMEIDSGGTRPADAIYELTRDLTLQSATFSDRYWEEHRALEARGVLSHDRAYCPDKNGPRSIEVWEPATGWRHVALNR